MLKQQDHQRWRYITMDFENINGYKWPHGMIGTNGFKRTTKHNDQSIILGGSSSTMLPVILALGHMYAKLFSVG